MTIAYVAGRLGTVFWTLVIDAGTVAVDTAVALEDWVRLVMVLAVPVAVAFPAVVATFAVCPPPCKGCGALPTAAC
jgi:hypothetical protein